jgi:hypothetical protein
MNASLALLNAALGLPADRAQEYDSRAVNRGRGPPLELTEAERQRVRSYCKWDLLLYEHARHLFEAQRLRLHLDATRAASPPLHGHSEL